jgi:hypothetical protein
MKFSPIILLISLVLFGCGSKVKDSPEVQQWTTYEYTLTSGNVYKNPYTDISVWAIFTNGKGDSLVRPAFWNGGNNWKLRFAPPDSGSTWTWSTFADQEAPGLSNQTGKLTSIAYTGTNDLLSHGLLHMSPGRRNALHHNGRPFLVVGDTPWSIPFRATTDQVTLYATDRQRKGFNTALLMSLQPDRYAEGPESRTEILGFDRAFEDLPDGHLNKLKPDYFQYLDSLVAILIQHGIVPVYQPVFHGYGWKGKTVLGTTADPKEYARYCKYLVARYGSMPAFWLVSGDATGRDPGVKPGGESVETWDCYGQPTGIHYSPADNYMAGWAQGDSSRCFHYNRTYQDEAWLDFQWAQSGHDGKHITYKVEEMYLNKPTKANLNGEPTYEGMSGGKYGLGWWQGQEAWTQLMHGGTMGVVYGAVGLWQWKITIDEPGWPIWTDHTVSWKEALNFEGSNYVGFVSKAFKGYDFGDMEKRWDLTGGSKPLLAKEGTFYVSYLESGGELTIKNVPVELPHRWFNPKTGEFTPEQMTQVPGVFRAPDENPWVLLVGHKRND